MKFLARTFVLCICLLAFHTAVLAQSLVVGISTGYPPYYYEEDGSYTGFCIEAINAVAEQLDIKVQYSAYPWKRMILSAQKGEVDAVMPLFKTDEREKYLIFDGLELAPETNNFFVSKESKISFNDSLDDLTSYRIGVVEGYSYGSRFDDFVFPKKEITKDDKHLLEMFTHSRFDIGVGNRFVVLHYAKLAQIDHTIRFLEPSITKETLYLGFVRKHSNEHFAQEFAEALSSFKESEAYRQLIDKYGIIE